MFNSPLYSCFSYSEPTAQCITFTKEVASLSKRSAGDTGQTGIAHIGAPVQVFSASYSANPLREDQGRRAVSEQLLDRHTTLCKIGLERTV